MKKLRSQQEQTLGTLDTRIEAMMKRRTQAIMDRLEGLLGNRSESRSRQATSGEPNREPRVKFNEQANRRRIYGSTRSSCSSSSYATGDKRPRGLNIRGGSNGNRPTSNERTMQNANAGLQNARLGDVIVQSVIVSHADQGRNRPSDANKRQNPELLSEGNDARAGHSRVAASMATAFEPLNRSLESFLTRLPVNAARGPGEYLRNRDVIKTNDGCIDTWIEVMKLHFEEEDLTERQKCSAFTSNLEGTVPNCVIAKKQYQRDTSEKIFQILLNRFGSGVKGHQAMMR